MNQLAVASFAFGIAGMALIGSPVIAGCVALLTAALLFAASLDRENGEQSTARNDQEGTKS